jgi:cellulose synthase/poly-beta-1,6-N-acetylglucosamine synthase-like glycosyltransferase
LLPARANDRIVGAEIFGPRVAAQGNWLCMLDSDDLLGKDYLQRAADFVLEDDHVDIIPGCMRNFDAGAWRDLRPVSPACCVSPGYTV